MAWREPPADQNVVSSNRISSAVMPLQRVTRCCLRLVCLRRNLPQVIDREY
jgi:hypothetical protein